MQRTILLATHGQPAAAGALRLAAALAARLEVSVDVLTVLEPLPPYASGFRPGLNPDARMETERATVHRERVREQLRTVVGAAADGWRISCRIGARADVIAGAARDSAVCMVVMGIGRHSPVDRLLGGETALRVSRASPVPVLAVAGDAAELPRRALIATDFSDSSARAARAAVSIMNEGAHITIAHAVPDSDLPTTDRDDWERVYLRGVAASLERLKSDIDAPPGLHFAHALLRGDPAEQLVLLAQNEPVDLIVAGSRGRSAFQRLLLGSVATKLLRTARCSVLLAPAES
jgi:nucleotide-binding universal stress UspA family protein